MADSFQALEEEREELVKNLKDFFEKNSKLFAIDLVFLYGSWAKGFPKDESDVDLALVFSEEVRGSDEAFRIITDISLTLEKVLKKQTNIIEIKRHFDRPMLYYNAIIQGLAIYIKDFDSYTRLRNEAIFQMEDFSLFGVGWQFEVARRNLEAIRNA